MDEAKEQVQEKAQEMTGQARDRARGMVDERSTQLGEQIGQQADDVRSIAQQMREQGKEGPAKMAEQAADRAERLGSYLRDSDGQSILGDVERMARNNPWAVVVGGIAVGFAASRFLKASSRERYRTSHGSSDQLTQLPRTVGASSAAPYGGGIGGATTSGPYGEGRGEATGGAYSTPSRADEAPIPPTGPGAPVAPTTGSTPLVTPSATAESGVSPRGPDTESEPGAKADRTTTQSQDRVRS